MPLQSTQPNIQTAYNPNTVPCNCPQVPQGSQQSLTLDSMRDQLTEEDIAFVTQVIAEVTQSCALPFAIPLDRVIFAIQQCAKWWWENYDLASEERYYMIPNKEVCRGNQFNKLVVLPQQILSVHGTYKVQQHLKYGAMGDFSMERMMLSTYSLMGGAGMVGGGALPGTYGGAGYNLTDVVSAMYEVDTFNQTLNPPLTFNFNPYSHKLVLLGDLGYSDLLICCWVRLRVQDLYGIYYFLRHVIAYCKRSLSLIYGMYEFKLPGGVTINYSQLSDEADKEIDEIREWVENQRSVGYFMLPNTL